MKVILKMEYSWIVVSLMMCLVVTTSGCYLHEKQDDVDQIHVIHLPASEEDNLSDSEEEIIEIHIPSDGDRKKREIDGSSSKTKKNCKTDADCPEGWNCGEILICHSTTTSENGLVQASGDIN
ncbi:uncharacterized protein LOC135169397 [Diachasmimorpha longicaudata]|uniref:uncharacterized protein LOC135169397 n=1 Tax=Diachasmimorpha longicaudata TaxID=58733 RepID=UPI0030B87156